MRFFTAIAPGNFIHRRKLLAIRRARRAVRVHCCGGPGLSVIDTPCGRHLVDTSPTRSQGKNRFQVSDMKSPGSRRISTQGKSKRVPVPIREFLLKGMWVGCPCGGWGLKERWEYRVPEDQPNNMQSKTRSFKPLDAP